MTVSIVIPIYNISTDIFIRCLNSALFQLSTTDEIIVIDDGSSDEFSEKYIQICNKDKRIKYHRQINSGPSVARNNGVLLATGDYILFLDSDDYLINGSIDQAKESINIYKPDIVLGYVYKDQSDDGTVRELICEEKPECLFFSDSSDIAILLNHILGYLSPKFTYDLGYISDGPWCRVFKRELFDSCCFNVDSKWNEDTLWNIELLNKCKSAVVCKSLWYVYAIREGSIMQSYRQNCLEEFIFISEKITSIGNLIWNGQIRKGISCRVWRDLFVLSQAYLFNANNNNSFNLNFQSLKEAIRSSPYQQAIHGIDFKFERNTKRRLMKQAMNIFMKFHMYFFVYVLLKKYVQMKQ